MVNSLKRSISKSEKRKIKHAKVKKTILLAFKEIIDEFGAENVTMNILAERTALSRATLYNYFESKEDLFIKLGIEAYDILTKKFEKATVKSKSGIENVEALGYAFIDFHTKQFFYRKALDYAGESYKKINIQIERLNSEKDQLKMERLKKILQNFEMHEMQFVKIWTFTIQQAIDDQTIRQDLSAPILAMTIGTLMTGLLDELLNRSSLMPNFAQASQNIIEIVMDFIKKGLKYEK
ncbi:hypothetical protein NEF87_003738 [Candidatus Lokiarchaeum ossiferum]|uniref:HTH tetR-type domain-containing protein n=1 Tax=Candidatus Lokiarchaeum ossiferum TaxID=2951803 RepID=A0ABY6HVA4_9ARCH|nr:hypothetical protein NEF87_003738 [Candidatus Lokiarchaeum sp. B-35]